MIPEFLSTYGYYGFLAVGAISMIILTVIRRKIYGLSLIKAVLFPLLLLVCGVSGAKFLYFIESGFKSFSGMSFFGAVFLVLLLMPIIGLAFRLKPLQSLDLCAPCVASIIGFMRFGCFCAGCCGGVLCVVGETTFHWPTQIIEGLGDMIILFVLLSVENKTKWKNCLYPIFLLSYGVMRFLIEFLRDTPKTILGFSEGQWLALLATIIGLVFVICLKTIKKKNGNNS